MFKGECPSCEETMVIAAHQSLRGWTCPKCEAIFIPGLEAKKIRRMYEHTSARPLGDFGAACKTRVMAERRRYLDQLTQVYEREYLQDVLRGYIDEGGARFAICLIDADHFKQVNEKYGYAVGDRVLVDIVGAVVGAVRDADIVGRYGGEEFIVIFEAVGDSPTFVAERIVSSVRNIEVSLNDGENSVIRPRVSVGVSIFPDHIAEFAEQLKTKEADGETTASPDAIMKLLIREANSALKVAKETGKDKFVLYDPDSVPLIGEQESIATRT